MKHYSPFILFILCILSSHRPAPAQHYFMTSRDLQEEVGVTDEGKNVLPYPWAGGMNSCQFGEVDMDMDGIKDLFVFDRMGDRVMTFLNGGAPNQPDFSYAPEFAAAFPDLKDWVILKDYDGDGRADIFTYAGNLPGIIVYRNISEDELEFELVVFPYLTSLQGGSQVNILTTDVDYPGIEDIDNDGDLDILTFWGLGSFVEYHQNQSMELYGIPDSLEYVEVTQCWGRFAESDESNVIYLDTCMGGGDAHEIKAGGSRHTGSTFLLTDLDGDADMDLVLGDVDYPNLIALVNGGSPDSAYMISQDPLFPSYDKPVNLFSMPAAAWLDVDNDGLKDLLLSPFDPSLITSANYRSVWLYRNTSSNEQPQFTFVQQDFLQEDMIDVGSGAYPVLEDYNGDGLLDLFVANFGYYMYSYYDAAMILHSVYWSNIALYEHTGTATSPQYSRVTHDYAGLHALHLTALYPTFGDLDGDGDRDLVSGRKDGSLVLLENVAGPGNIPEYGEAELNYQDIDVGGFSTPQLYDLDGDGLLDLAIGEMNGNINYYRNIGSASQPSFTFVTDSLGKVNVTDYTLSYTGYSTPRFYQQNGSTRLLVGSEQGKLFYFRNIDGNLDGPFIEEDSLSFIVGDQGLGSLKGIRTAAAIAELTGDSEPELIIGNYAGGLHFFKGTDQPPVSGLEDEEVSVLPDPFPNPVMDRLHLDVDLAAGDLPVTVYDVYGRPVLTGRLAQHTPALDVRSLPSGLYMYRIGPDRRSQRVFTGKFVKSR